MEESRTPARSGKRMLYIGRAVSAVPVLLFTLGGVMSLAAPDQMREGMEKLGWPASKAAPLAVLQLSCALLYAIPRTAVLGAILLTGYLGGAVATHVRVDDMWFAAAGTGVVVWIGLWLREPRLRALAPLRSRPGGA